MNRIWKKEIIGQMHRCYSVQTAQIGGMQKLLIASEAENGGLAVYDAREERPCEWLTQNVGGTMSIVAVPGVADTLYVSRKFHPGFQGGDADVLCCRKTETGWEETVVLNLPYLHRFDVFQVGSKRIFVGCTLCSSKQSREDWSDPGAVYVGFLQDDPAKPFSVTPLVTGMLKNHGYWRGVRNGQEVGYIAAENGVYLFTPGQTLQQCSCIRLFDQPVSEVVFWDFDGDGVEEMAMIAPMHGAQVSVLHEDGKGGYQEVYRCPLDLEFCHAMWGGTFQGEPMLICSGRRKEKPLFCITCRDGVYETEIIDMQVGSANVCVYSHGGEQVILSANNGCHEIALYTSVKK